MRSGGIFAILFRCAMLRNRWRSVVSTSITQPSGAGCSITAPSWSKRLRRYRKATNKSWRVDETYVRVKGRWCYLYRAIDSTGATIDFLLSALRDADAAKCLFRKALKPASATRIYSIRSLSFSVAIPFSEMMMGFLQCYAT